MPQTAPSLSSLRERWGHQRNSVALGQGGPRSHSSMQVLEIKEPSPWWSGLRGEGEDGREDGPEEQLGRAWRI